MEFTRLVLRDVITCTHQLRIIFFINIERHDTLGYLQGSCLPNGECKSHIAKRKL